MIYRPKKALFISLVIWFGLFIQLWFFGSAALMAWTNKPGNGGTAIVLLVPLALYVAFAVVPYCSTSYEIAPAL